MITTALPLSASEGGGAATFSFHLAAVPTAEVTVTLTVPETAAATVIGPNDGVAQFDATNGLVDQAAVVVGINDHAFGVDHAFTVRLYATSDDPCIGGRQQVISGVSHAADRRVFLAASHNGALGGVADADLVCTQAAGRAGYKALLVDGTTRVATTMAQTSEGQVDWVLRGSTDYWLGGPGVVTPGHVMRTDGNAFVLVPLVSALAVSGSTTVWTGLNADFTTAATLCDGWNTAADTQPGAAGLAAASDEAAYSGTVVNCDQLGAILCVEQ